MIKFAAVPSRFCASVLVSDWSVLFLCVWLTDCSYTCHLECKSKVQIDCNKRDREPKEAPSPRRHSSSTGSQCRVSILKDMTGNGCHFWGGYRGRVSTLTCAAEVYVSQGWVMEEFFPSVPTLLHNHPPLWLHAVSPPWLSTYECIYALICFFWSQSVPRTKYATSH